jgi:hypothetical protein
MFSKKAIEPMKGLLALRNCAVRSEASALLVGRFLTLWI